MKKKGIISLILGVITGATVGVLFSPDKGENIRKNIKSKIKKEKWVDKAKSFFKDLKNELKEEFDDLKKELKEEVKEVKESNKKED
ncbi:YtxH domain-containing protein [bacterium]|jgi:gas vesicle protein|nr:YtxH domain-containing protein [bacterium]MBT6293413.1 YtxH domain-containing protein [bacterium]